ncbi:hypothetical protein, conserved [Plasmodium vivax]|uniref:Uncharacterized protein n=3 Tax=Plasmodium vivax TaxID=5855 RepID=A5K7G3_PLAVS|nr:hypothetical protein, conserved [Plasmodium vivax]EDL44722.1 hypothetical protein, conserved [Plasmodium vivax]KNA00098.1 hypothetical protein PVNG_02094 [Plasmodium vivax North Korean]|eukprot:XP_001614449.1 hypothetical protein [Plasmodium vivax Sal-1]
MRMIIFYLAILCYVSSAADSQTKSNQNYLLKNHEPSKISRKKARKYDKHGLTNFTDFSFVSQAEASDSEAHAGKEGKKEEKDKKNDTGKDDWKGKHEEHAMHEGEVKHAVQETHGEKKPSNEEKNKKESKDDAEDDDNVDEGDEGDNDGEDDDEDGEPKINSKKKGNLKEDKKGGDNKEKKKKTKGDFDDDENSEEDEDDENEDEADGEDEDEEEEMGKKPSNKKDIEKQQKGSDKNDEKGKKEIKVHGGDEHKHEEHHEVHTAGKHQGDNHVQAHAQKTHNAAEKQQSGKEANNNQAAHNPEVKTSVPILSNIEQRQPTSPPLSNVAQNAIPALSAFIPKREDPIVPHNNNVKINEDIHIPDDIKKDFMKLLRSVVQLNVKEALHQGNSHHPHGDQQKNSSGMPPTHMNAPPGNGTNNTSFLNRLMDHFKKYLLYYLGGLVVFSAFALAMQCSDVSDKKRKNPAKRDRSKITNYRRDIES